MYLYAEWTKSRQYKSIVSSTYSFCYSVPYLVLILEANNYFNETESFLPSSENTEALIISPADERVPSRLPYETPL